MRKTFFSPQMHTRKKPQNKKFDSLKENRKIEIEEKKKISTDNEKDQKNDP